MSFRWTLEQLNPAMRQQAKAKLGMLNGKPRTHQIKDDNERREPAEFGSQLERRFAQQLKEAGIATEREWFPVLGRDYRLDFAVPEKRIGVEVQGGQHRVKGRFRADIEKRALCLLAGWRVLEISNNEIRTGKGIEWLKELLK